jgi:hypothetical protein
MERAGEGCAP